MRIDAASAPQAAHQDEGDGQEDEDAQTAKLEECPGQLEQRPQHQEQDDQGNGDPGQDE
jgi:hypothetical protein